MKYYAAIDTNVIVSAMLKWNSIPGAVLELVFEGIIILLLNDEIVREYREVLARPRFHFTPDIIDAAVDEIVRHGLFVDAGKLEIEFPDSEDLVYYEVVMEERKEQDAYLVTGNIKHFPKKPFVVTPRQMLEIIILHDM